MRRPARKTHPEFDLTELYEYPQHLRDAIDHLPSAPGVYIFRGEEGDLPLYIGKSVNLRTRVLSHLRTEEEARMLRQTRSIDFERTAGEIGALLREAQLIKQLQPLYNQKLRRSKQLCSWYMPTEVTAAPRLVFSRDLNFASTTGICGLYSSRHSAVRGLQALADQHQLCYGLLGMERLNQGRGCFRSMLSQCNGACCGKETREAHDERLRTAMQELQVHCWPYPGAVGLLERWEDWTQLHVIHQWCYLGSAADASKARELTSQASGFDADGYKILCGPMLSGQHELIPLWT